MEAAEIAMLARVTADGMALKEAGDFRSSKRVVLAAVEQNGEALQYASTELRSDAQVALAAVSCCGSALLDAAEALLDNEEIVLAAVMNEPWVLEYAHPRLRANETIVRAAVQKDGHALMHVSDELRKSVEIVRMAVGKNGCALRFADVTLRDDESIVRAAIRKNALALMFASGRLRKNKELVLTALDAAPAGMALMRASAELQDDKEVVLKAVRHDALAFHHASPRLQDDRDVQRQTAWPGPPDALARAQHAARVTGSAPPVVMRTNVRQRRASRLTSATGKRDVHRHIKIKYDNYLEGEKPCPKCHAAVKVSEDGCSQTICKVKSKYHPGGGWFYFCWHCDADLGEHNQHVHCNNGCPHENNPDTRAMYLRMKRTKRRRAAKRQLQEGGVEQIEIDVDEPATSAQPASTHPVESQLADEAAGEGQGASEAVGQDHAQMEVEETEVEETEAPAVQ